MKKALIVSVSAACLMLAACQSSPTGSNKDMLLKMRDVASDTFREPAKKLAPAAVTIPTTIPVAPTTWKDSAGTQYTLAPSLSYVPMPAVVTPPPPVTATLGPPVVQTPSTTVNPGTVVGMAWVGQGDPGTPGTATGTMTYPVAGMSGTNTARQFNVTYQGKAGYLYHVTFGHDPIATHFIYDAYVNFPDVSQLQNVEMDMNQVVANGNTVILATQCASGSKTWEITFAKTGGGTHWNPSNVPCNPLTWTPNVWHHIQLATHHDANGNVTYDWVGFDGMYSNFTGTNTGPSTYALKWAAGTLLINFQLDGLLNSGTMAAKIDQTTVYRW